jgi:DNA polymerase
MNAGDLKKITSFIAQRREMGETEWDIDPASAFPDETAKPASQKSASAQIDPGHMRDSMPSEESGGGNESCGIGDFGVDLIGKQTTLDGLNDAVCGCKRCPLGETRIKFVFGSGNPDAGIMFIGEAPGADEDEQGLPFVGRAGKLLTKMIESIRLTRDEVYIGNILKCRPPGNRDPRPDEIVKCEPIFIRQIELIKPKIIFALGRISGQTLLKTNDPLRAMRGKIHDYHGFKLMVSYHPAALLRNPNWKPAAWEDLKFLRREYDGLEL